MWSVETSVISLRGHACLHALELWAKDAMLTKTLTMAPWRCRLQHAYKACE